MSLNFFSKPTSQDWPTGHKILDDYEVMRVLGEGGMGKVYLVRSLSSGSKFAVKRAKCLNDADRKNFLAELQTWIDLPHHPNLVSCRFFRTLGAEVLIFAEYIEGGSLKDWIDSRRLYEGGSDQALERILDVSIQLAWGLHCVHELGTIHQDVKPSNVLITSDGIVEAQGIKPQVTDFGLARARAAAGEHFATDPYRSILVSSIRGTPPYWSPEQSQGLPLTHKADIWSWGLTIMEMFTGGLTWVSGLGAVEVLEQHLQEDGSDDEIPSMPSGVVDLLKQCFHPVPIERPATLAEAVEKLQAVYKHSMCIDYSRRREAIDGADSAQTGIKERRTIEGVKWAEPQKWLAKALRAAGRDPAEAVVIVERRCMTRQGQLVSELMIYDEAKSLYEKLVRDGSKEFESDLASLCMQKAMVHTTAADKNGALEEYDQAIVIRERLVTQDGRSELANSLATAYTNKADIVSSLGKKRAAIALYDQAIAICERIANKEGLAAASHNMANAFSDLGDKRGAIVLYDQVIAIWDPLVNQEGRRELANKLASAYQNNAAMHSYLGDDNTALTLYDQAIAIFERLINKENRIELNNDLARAYINKAISFIAMGDYCNAIMLYDQAIAIRERLVNQEGRHELANYLASTYENKATAVSASGDKRGAIALYDQAIAIQERLVNQEGRHDLANSLARSYSNKAVVIKALGDYRWALEVNDQAIAVMEWMVNKEGRCELSKDLAVSYLNKANTAIALGNHRLAVTLYDQAIAIRERLVNQEGRRELTGDLAQLLAYRGSALIALNEKVKGLKDMLNAQGVLESEITRTGRADLKQILNWLNQQLKNNSI
jgi:tetratricopeptide (TPR) repeat protein